MLLFAYLYFRYLFAFLPNIFLPLLRLNHCTLPNHLLIGNRDIGVIAGGVAAVAALLFAIPAIALVWWWRRKPQDHFVDVPG